MTLTIGRFTGEAEDWNRVVSRSAGGTVCHRYEWRSLMGDVFGHEAIFLGATESDRGLVGVLPLVRVRSRLFGHYLVSMPFLNAGGPLGTPEACTALADEAERMALADGVDLLEMRSLVEQPLSLEVSHRKLTVILELPADPDELFASFPAKLRSQIRRPAKAGIETRFGPDQVRPFYRVFARHMRDLGTPVLPLTFFEAIQNRFPSAAWFCCSYHDGTPVAGGAGFHHGTRSEITWASSLNSYSRMAPNMGLYWAAMTQAIDVGATQFDFGRCTSGSGTHRFKRQWGGADVPLWWYQDRVSGEKTQTPAPDQGAYALGPKLWRHLPLGIANRLGPHIVKYIP